VRNSVSAYLLRFPQGSWCSEQQGSSSPDSQEQSQEKRDEQSELAKRVEPEQEETELTTAANCHPCHFDGTHVVFIKSNTPGVYLLEVRDWTRKEKATVQTITIQRSVFNWLTPKSIQCLDDFLMAVTSFNTVKIWSIQSGKLLYKLKGHGHLSRIVAARMVYPPNISEASTPPSASLSIKSPFIVTMATDRRVFVWRDGAVLQKLSLPVEKTQFHLGGPYYMEPGFSLLASDESQHLWTMSKLVYTDDTGVHLAWS
jgi:WD40 repeat protein